MGASCGNPEGRVEFNALRVRAHYLETMMRMRVLDGGSFDDVSSSDALDALC